MPRYPLSHACSILLLAAVCGLLPAQVNPNNDTPAARRERLVNAGYSQIGVTTGYDPAYVKLPYPGGDVPSDRGVCTDVIIRALRGVGVDLQVLVHEDKEKSPAAYKGDGAAPEPDASIDHRRVPNLMVFFKRAGKQLPLTQQGADYLPGDIVVWRIPSGLLHVGLVSDRLAPGSDRPLMIHNIGEGAQCEDVIFRFHLVAHYRWYV